MTMAALSSCEDAIRMGAVRQECFQSFASALSQWACGRRALTNVVLRELLKSLATKSNSSIASMNCNDRQLFAQPKMRALARTPSTAFMSLISSDWTRCMRIVGHVATPAGRIFFTPERAERRTPVVYHMM